MEAKNVWIQGDSAVVLNWLQHKPTNQLSPSPWMKDICFWLEALNFSLSRLCREGNQAADWVANRAFMGDLFISADRIHLHPSFARILLADAYSIGSPRHGI
ncbi:putative Ribonuclease H protein [Cocos nucifera]|uniref:Putative Ribonuclease H protein n=1 Tax=Cocos nucifera TaxID=13894 RepID=A0A8K0HZM7_COCNU|nr:putative Ribonuclease H protein [Cocos nucifera]